MATHEHGQMTSANTLYFITGNTGKYTEIQTMLPTIEQLNINLPEIQSLDAKEVIKDKLLRAKEAFSGRFIVEDTSLIMHGLKGLPGTFIKWFLQRMSLTELANLAIKTGDVSASAKVCIGYLHDETIQFFESTINGTIVLPKGKEGFGWDKLFVPEGHNKTFGEMSREEKNTMSMRRQAIEQLKQHL